MIVEYKTYRLKRGKREAVAELLRTKLFPEMRRIGIKCAGPWLSVDDDQSILFTRGFPDAEKREIMTNQLYGGAFWEEDMADNILPYLEKNEGVSIEIDEKAVAWD